MKRKTASILMLLSLILISNLLAKTIGGTIKFSDDRPLANHFIRIGLGAGQWFYTKTGKRGEFTYTTPTSWKGGQVTLDINLTDHVVLFPNKGIIPIRLGSETFDEEILIVRKELAQLIGTNLREVERIVLDSDIGRDEILEQNQKIMIATLRELALDHQKTRSDLDDLKRRLDELSYLNKLIFKHNIELENIVKAYEITKNKASLPSIIQPDDYLSDGLRVKGSIVRAKGNLEKNYLQLQEAKKYFIQSIAAANSFELKTEGLHRLTEIYRDLGNDEFAQTAFNVSTVLPELSKKVGPLIIGAPELWSLNNWIVEEARRSGTLVDGIYLGIVDIQVGGVTVSPYYRVSPFEPPSVGLHFNLTNLLKKKD